MVETDDDTTAKAMTAVIQNRHYRTTETLLSSMRLPYIEEEIKKYVDCAAVIRHSCTICSKHDFEKIIKLLFGFLQNAYGDKANSRLVPVLFIDNAGVVPKEFQIHQLSLIERLHINNYEQALRILGELDYKIVKLAEGNPDTVQQCIKNAIITANNIAGTLPLRSQSNSAIMFLATANILKEGGLFTDADVQAMLKWLSTEAKERNTLSRSVCKAVGTTLSNAICSERLPIAKQYGSPFWTADSAFNAGDDTINVTKDILEDELLSDVLIGRDIALKYLKDEDVLFTNKGEDQKTWTVENEDGVKKLRRFYCDGYSRFWQDGLDDDASSSKSNVRRRCSGSRSNKCFL